MQKGVYLYEYMDNWKKNHQNFNIWKRRFTDADYTHIKRICKDFKLKNLGEHHDLHVQNNILLLADVFENFQNMCLEIYELDPAYFVTALGLAWEAAIKKTNQISDLLTGIIILLMIEKGIRRWRILIS